MTVRAAVVYAVCSLALFGLVAAGVLTGETQRTDLTIRAVVHSWESPALTAVMTFVTRWGAPRADAIVVLIASVALILKRCPQAAVWLVAALIGAGLLRYSLAYAFARPRPMPFFALRPSSYSFPSGHAVYCVCVYGALAGLLTAGVRRRIERLLIWSLVLLWIAAIGLSRVYLGFHYPTDVLAGYAIGVAWIGLLALAARVLPFRPFESAARRMPTGQ